jgi:hypothetical protein
MQRAFYFMFKNNGGGEGKRRGEEGRGKGEVHV